MEELTRVALLSDVHGNLTALDEVLADLATVERVDEVWALGDLVAIGPDPVGVLERLTSLPACRFLAGNTERYTFTGERSLPDPPTAAERPHLPGLVAGFAWTAGRLEAAGWLDWIGRLPGMLDGRLVGDRRLVAVHATPDRDDGPGIHPDRSDDELDSMLAATSADVLCAGHTHVPLWRRTTLGHVFNPGSVSNPALHSDGRASYAILEASDGGTVVEHRKVTYDHTAVLTQLAELRHPSLGFIEDHYFRPHLTDHTPPPATDP